MEPTIETPPEELAKPTGKAIEIEACTVKSLADAERLVSAIEMAARRAFGHRPSALGTRSMEVDDLARTLEQVPGACLRAAVTMAGTIEIYDGEELQGFVEVREGGGYVGI